MYGTTEKVLSGRGSVFSSSLNGTRFLSAAQFSAIGSTPLVEHQDYMDFAERYADYVCDYEKANSR